MLLLASLVCGLFKWRQFEPEVILVAVGWYLRFSLSYRDVEELLAERGLRADHVTVWRWVQRYAPVRPGVGSVPAQKTQGNKRLLAGGRDLHPG
jgi:transposase-like protein